MDNGASEPIPAILTTMPLYQRISIENPDGVSVRGVVMYSGKFDAFCPGCGMNATFSGVVTDEWKHAVNVHSRSITAASLSAASRGNLRVDDPFAISTFSKTVRCTRDDRHSITSHFQVADDCVYIQKIGQYPSVADVLKGDIRELAPELGRDRAREFNLAITAAAHGVGIGAHVYLRRIFESLVEEAHQRARANDGWNEEVYEKARMVDKVAMLRSELPAFLAEHPQLYSVLSIHLHALSEEVARQNFEKLKQAILIIAEQKREVKKMAERERAARAALGEVVRDIAPVRPARE